MHAGRHRDILMRARGVVACSIVRGLRAKGKHLVKKRAGGAFDALLVSVPDTLISFKTAGNPKLCCERRRRPTKAKVPPIPETSLRCRNREARREHQSSVI